MGGKASVFPVPPTRSASFDPRRLPSFRCLQDLQDYSAPDHVAVNRALPVDSGGAIAVRVEFTSFTAAADMPGSESDGAGAGVAYDDDDDEDDGDDYAAYQSDDSTGAAPSASAPPKPLALDMYIHGAVNLKRVVQGLRSQTP